MNLQRFVALMGGLLLTAVAHPTPNPLTVPAPSYAPENTFNPYRKGTAAIKREAAKKRNRKK